MAEGRERRHALDMGDQRVGAVQRETAQDGGAGAKMNITAVVGEQVMLHRGR
jgi:hypothetical protein